MGGGGEGGAAPIKRNRAKQGFKEVELELRFSGNNQEILFEKYLSQ